MKERPILFNAPMVRAILDGQKTQTRRAVKPQPHAGVRWNPIVLCGKAGWEDGHGTSLHCPYGQPGDRLWVRETCRAEELPSGLDGVRYIADNHFEPIKDSPGDAFQWMHLNAYRAESGAIVPSIHMPRWASRILLEVVSVRVERLQDISEADAIAEGVKSCESELVTNGCWYSADELYSMLWTKINGHGSWNSNPWVWAVEFERVQTSTQPDQEESATT